MAAGVNGHDGQRVDYYREKCADIFFGEPMECAYYLSCGCNFGNQEHLRNWLDINRACPLCRAPVSDEIKINRHANALYEDLMIEARKTDKLRLKKITLKQENSEFRNLLTTAIEQINARDTIWEERLKKQEERLEKNHQEEIKKIKAYWTKKAADLETKFRNLPATKGTEVLDPNTKAELESLQKQVTELEERLRNSQESSISLSCPERLLLRLSSLIKRALCCQKTGLYRGGRLICQ